MKTKMILEPMILRQYQMCTPRDDLQRLYLISERIGSKKQRIQTQFGGLARNFRAARPAMSDFKTLIFEPHSPTSAFCSFPLAFERIGPEKQRIQRHVGGLSRLLTSVARKRRHAKGEEILQKIYSRPAR